jgi:hypothetical protein
MTSEYVSTSFEERENSVLKKTGIPPTFATGNGHDHKRENEIEIDTTGDADELDTTF